MRNRDIKQAAQASVLQSYGLFHGVKLALNDVGTYRFNSTAESIDKKDSLDRLWGAFDRKANPTGNESAQGAIFSEGTTG